MDAERLSRFLHAAAGKCVLGMAASVALGIGSAPALRWTCRFLSIEGVALPVETLSSLRFQSEVLSDLAFYLCSLSLFFLIWCGFSIFLLRQAENISKGSRDNDHNVPYKKDFCLKISQQERN